MGKLSIFGELMTFLWERKLFWLSPIVVMLVLIGALIVFSESSALAPFIYAIF